MSKVELFNNLLNGWHFLDYVAERMGASVMLDTYSYTMNLLFPLETDDEIALKSKRDLLEHYSIGIVAGEEVGELVDILWKK